MTNGRLGTIAAWHDEPVKVVAYVDQPSYIVETLDGKRLTISADLLSDATPEQVRSFSCGCLSCDDTRRKAEFARTRNSSVLLMRRMIVCEYCGSKRCPHAADHNNACTDE